MSKGEPRAVIQFEHPTPELDYVADAMSGKARLFDPDGAESGAWIEADIGTFIPGRLAA